MSTSGGGGSGGSDSSSDDEENIDEMTPEAIDAEIAFLQAAATARALRKGASRKQRKQFDPESCLLN